MLHRATRPPVRRRPQEPWYALLLEWDEIQEDDADDDDELDASSNTVSSARRAIAGPTSQQGRAGCNIRRTAHLSDAQGLAPTLAPI